jgi:FixJ family two-component response regulator
MLSMSTLPSVMVVDDEEELANLFMVLLKGSGFNSVSFTNPLQAIEHFKQSLEKYTPIITDLRMPGKYDLELAKN